MNGCIIPLLCPLVLIIHFSYDKFFQLVLVFCPLYLSAWTVSNISICLALSMMSIFSLPQSLLLSHSCYPTNKQAEWLSHSNYLIIFLCGFLAIKPLGLAYVKQLPVVSLSLFFSLVSFSWVFLSFISKSLYHSLFYLFGPLLLFWFLCSHCLHLLFNFGVD